MTDIERKTYKGELAASNTKKGIHRKVIPFVKNRDTKKQTAPALPESRCKRNKKKKKVTKDDDDHSNPRMTTLTTQQHFLNCDVAVKWIRKRRK